MSVVLCCPKIRTPHDLLGPGSSQAFKSVAIRRLRGNHGDKRTVVRLLAELNLTVGQCEQGVILAHSNVLAWVVLGSALTHENVASNALLTTKDFYTQPFALGLTSVLRTRCRFCVPWYRGLETHQVCVILLSFWPPASWLLASWLLASAAAAAAAAALLLLLLLLLAAAPAAAPWPQSPSWERLQPWAQPPFLAGLLCRRLFDVCDLDFGQGRTKAIELLISFATLLLEDKHLVLTSQTPPNTTAPPTRCRRVSASSSNQPHIGQPAGRM